MWDIPDVGCSGCGMFGMWDVRDVGCSGCGMCRMWDVQDVGCAGCGTFGMWDVRDVGCSRCGMFGMWDVGCFAGMWDVNLQNAQIAQYLISRGSQTMKFGHLIEHNMRNVFLEKSCTNCGKKYSTRPFSTKSNQV